MVIQNPKENQVNEINRLFLPTYSIVIFDWYFLRYKKEPESDRSVGMKSVVRGTSITKGIAVLRGVEARHGIISSGNNNRW